ncbi:MAG: hypothetical protein SGJ27_14655 [Candidatus Melainabacteria bacterium]|nr:hypothetical protein [Candidatus Melainabacteria bacterium]
MARGDRPDVGDTGADNDTNPNSVGLEARTNLALAAADGPQPQTWSRNDGGRYFDQPQGVDRPQQAGQASWTEIPTVGGNTVRIDPRGNMVDVIGADGKPLGRGRLTKGEPTPIMIGNTRILVNPDMTVDVPSEKGLTRTYPTRVSEYYDRVDNTYRIANRTFPDGSYEKFNNGRLAETNYEGFITRFDNAGRKFEVNTPQGDKFAFKFGADGKVDSYDVTRKNEKNEVQLVERGIKGPDGSLRIERRQRDGTMAVEPRLAGRTDVAIRSDLRLDYLDKDGYGVLDSNKRMIKRDDRTVMASSPDANLAPYPVNPIRSVRMEDGRQIDYEYSSDKFRDRGQNQGDDGLLSYTVRDRNGKAVEFGHRISDIPDTTRKNNTGWFEFKAGPGQSLPEDQIAKVKQLMTPADPARLADPQERAKVQQEMLANRNQLVQDKPMKDFMPKLAPGEKGKETVDVVIDHTTGRQYNVYGNGETRVRNERGQEFISTYDRNTGDAFETYGDGTTLRRPWDADPKKGNSDRITITSRNAEGVPRVEMHHSRKDNSLIDVNYDKTGKIPTEVIVTPAGGQPIKMAPARDNPDSWLEYKQEGTAENPIWKPTGRAFPMKVDLIGNNDGRFTNEGKQLPAGTVIISQGEKRRIITPAGEEIVGKTGSTPSDTVPERVWLTPPLPNSQGPERPQQKAPPEWTQQGPPGTRRDGRPREPQQPRTVPPERERPRMPTKK